MLRFRKYFRQKIGEKLTILSRNTDKYAGKKSQHYFLKNRQFFVENWRKSPKIVTITYVSSEENRHFFIRRKLAEIVIVTLTTNLSF
jgi:hypothetical protein